MGGCQRACPTRFLTSPPTSQAYDIVLEAGAPRCMCPFPPCLDMRGVSACVATVSTLDSRQFPTRQGSGPRLAPSPVAHVYFHGLLARQACHSPKLLERHTSMTFGSARRGVQRHLRSHIPRLLISDCLITASLGHCPQCPHHRFPECLSQPHRHRISYLLVHLCPREAIE